MFYYISSVVVLRENSDGFPFKIYKCPALSRKKKIMVALTMPQKQSIIILTEISLIVYKSVRSWW